MRSQFNRRQARLARSRRRLWLLKGSTRLTGRTSLSRLKMSLDVEAISSYVTLRCNVDVRQRFDECWERTADSLRGGKVAALLNLISTIAFITASSQVSAQPPTFASLLKTATALHHQGDYSHSIPILKQLVERDPQNYDANLLLGEDLFHNGSIHDALAPLEAAAKARPKDGTALTLLADAALDLGDHATAADALQAAVARDPGAEQVLVNWADYCLDRSRVLGQQMRTTKRGEEIGRAS